MTSTLSRQQARQLDRLAVEAYGMASVQLMENAGRGVADRICQWQAPAPVVICCGRGNNGGDGFVVARHLDLRGVDVRVLVIDDPARLTGDAARNFQVIRTAGLAIHRVEPAELDQHLAAAAYVVDALLGTGVRGEPRPPYDEVIERINARGSPVLAIDVPSGLDCDTGQPASRTIRAAATCTFVAVKQGFLAPGARAYTGEVHVLDIGAPRKLVEEILGS